MDERGLLRPSSGGREGENSTRDCPSYSLRAGVSFAGPPDHRFRISGKKEARACRVRFRPPCGVFTLRWRLYAAALACRSPKTRCFAMQFIGSSMNARNVKLASEVRLKSLGVLVNEHLPTLEKVGELKPRTARD